LITGIHALQVLFKDELIQDNAGILTFAELFSEPIARSDTGFLQKMEFKPFQMVKA
jgi:hypothetical protein